MRLLMKTNNITTVVFAKTLLRAAGIMCFELDVNMSVIEGSVSILPRRLMVPDDQYEDAVQVLRDNGLIDADE